MLILELMQILLNIVSLGNNVLSACDRLLRQRV